MINFMVLFDRISNFQFTTSHADNHDAMLVSSVSDHCGYKLHNDHFILKVFDFKNGRKFMQYD